MLVKKMNDIKQLAECYIKKLGGTDDADACRRLIEADHSIITYLIEYFRIQKDAAIRAELVEIVWQHRVSQTTVIDFLAEALDDRQPEVWKNALDGLVTFGGEAATSILESYKQQIAQNNVSNPEKSEWIDESIQQINENRTQNGS
jgi:hypothetical protein